MKKINVNKLTRIVQHSRIDLSIIKDAVHKLPEETIADEVHKAYILGIVTHLQYMIIQDLNEICGSDPIEG
jgi:hypothetical protein